MRLIPLYPKFLIWAFSCTRCSRLQPALNVLLSNYSKLTLPISTIYSLHLANYLNCSSIALSCIYFHTMSITTRSIFSHQRRHLWLSSRHYVALHGSSSLTSWAPSSSSSSLLTDHKQLQRCILPSTVLECADAELVKSMKAIWLCIIDTFYQL